MLNFISRAPLTFFLIINQCIVFILEVEYAVKPWRAALRADISTLLAMGGVNAQTLVDIGAFRLVSSAFLHHDLMHLSINIIAFAIAGRMIEEYFGKLSLLPIFVICAGAASFFSVTFNPPYVIGVGASGAIMGMLMLVVTLFMLHPDYKNHPAKSRMLMQSMWIILPSLLPLARAGTQMTDYTAHVGGCIAGLILGTLITAFAFVDTLRKSTKPLLGILTLASVGILLYTAFKIMSDYALFVKIFEEG